MPSFPAINLGVKTQRPYQIRREFLNEKNDMATGRRFAYAWRATPISIIILKYPVITAEESQILEDFFAEMLGRRGEFDLRLLEIGSSETITNATNASPIVITATAHGYASGQTVTVSGVLGNIAANGTWTVTVLTANTFSLNGSTGNGAYVSGGSAVYQDLFFPKCRFDQDEFQVEYPQKAQHSVELRIAEFR